MADWLDDTEDDEEGTGGVAHALASPRTMFVSDDQGGVTDSAPRPVEKASSATPQPDTNRDADEEAAQIAQPSQSKPEPEPQDAAASDFLLPSAPAASGSQSSEDHEYDEETLTPPVVPVAPKLPDSSAEREELAQTIKNFNPNDYKPSGWRRAGAAIAGALTTFGSHNPQAGMQVGEAALDAPLNRAKAIEQQKEDALRQQIQGTDQQRANAQQDYNNQVSQFNAGERAIGDRQKIEDLRALADQRRANTQAKKDQIVQFTPSDPNNPYAGGVGVTADGRTMRNIQPPDAWVKTWSSTPQGKAALLRMDVQARQEIADSIFGKGNSENKQQFVATGKVSPPPRTTVRVPSASLQEYDDWKGAFQRENGRAPNAAEIAGWQHKQSGAISQSLSDKIVAQKKAAEQRVMSVDPIDPKDPAASGEQRRSDLQAIEDEYEARIEDLTGQAVPHVTVQTDKNGNPQYVDPEGSILASTPNPGATSPRTPGPARQQSQQGAAVVRFGNGQKLSDPNIARQYLAKAGGDKNKARQLAEQDHWKL